MNFNYFQILFYFFSLIGIIFVSTLNNPPIFGKTKFLFLNTFSTSYEISDQLENEYSLGNRLVSDPITENFLFGAYGIDVKEKYRDLNPYSNLSLSVEALILQSSEKGIDCLVNLKGFPESWVPRLTGHWNPIISNTARFYEYNGYRGKKLSITLKEQLRGKCLVVVDKENPWNQGENFRYHNPNLNATHEGSVHILQFKESISSPVHNILIDVGLKTSDSDKLLEYLAMNEIYSIDEFFLLSTHGDNYSVIFDLVKFGIPIGKVLAYNPTKEFCDQARYSFCDNTGFLKLKNLLIEKKIRFQPINQITQAEAVVAFKNKHNSLSVFFPLSKMVSDPNSMAINIPIVRLLTNMKSYLFLNPYYIPINLEQNLKSDIYTIPYSQEWFNFYNHFDLAGAKIGIIKSPNAFWCNQTNYRIRNYFNKKKMKIYLSSYHGNILIRHFEDQTFKVKTELEPKQICSERVSEFPWRNLFSN